MIDSGSGLERSTSRVHAGLYAAGVFVLALLPRITNLATLITPDERRWVARSVSFFGALLQGDWSHTFQTGHPGVTTMWTGTMSLWVKHLLEQPSTDLLEYLGQIQTRPAPTPEYLATTRLPTGILTAAAIAAAYLLLLRLFGQKPALIGAGLLALDPFYLAHSRVIHHDALVTTFVLLALLTFVHYVWRGRKPLWLVLSAVATALACLSKGSALFLLPFVGLVGLAAMWIDLSNRVAPSRDVVRRWMVSLALWGGVVIIVFAVLWPAMWVDPIGTLGGMFGKAVQYAEEAHTKGNFFLGVPVEDPGFLFYPLVLLFRTTPLTLIGLVLCVVQLAVHARGRRLKDLTDEPDTTTLITLLGFVVLFTAFMSFGAKKFDRYLLPTFPIVDILAGVAFAQLIRRAETLNIRSAAVGAILPALLCLQALASLPQHPYYLSVYNVLAGGPWLAQKVLLVGWGEGMEQAADYLNAKPDIERQRAAIFYSTDFYAFYKGTAAKLLDDRPGEPQPWVGSDYVVFYICQVQRQLPDPATVRYFQSLTPEYTFDRNGIPYIQIYRMPSNVPAELKIQQENGAVPDQEQ